MKNYTVILLTIAAISLVAIPATAQHHHKHIFHKNGGRSIISGKVFSTENGEAVNFATVYLKGTNHGCATDENGEYRIKAPIGDYMLVVSAVGYSTAETEISITKGRHTVQNMEIAPE